VEDEEPLDGWAFDQKMQAMLDDPVQSAIILFETDEICEPCEIALGEAVEMMVFSQAADTYDSEIGSEKGASDDFTQGKGCGSRLQ
jgi:hypothetical protein